MVRARKKFTKKELKEDKFILTVFKIRDYLEQNASRIGLGILALVVLFFGFTYYQNQKEAKNAQAAVEMLQAQLVMQQGNEQEALQRLSNIAEQYGGTPAGGQATYALARYYLDKGDFETAKQYFQRYLNDYGDDPVLRAAALAGYADCLLNEGDTLQAAQYYEKAARVDPEFILAPAYLYSAARAYFEAGELEKAQKLAQKLVDEYEKSEYRDRARLLLNMVSLKLAQG